jgi:hypothetical protein
MRAPTPDRFKPDRSASPTTAISLATHLRVNPDNRKFGTLNHGLRVRVLAGWVHSSTAYEPSTGG